MHLQNFPDRAARIAEIQHVCTSILRCMMILLHDPGSPYARKVRIAVHLLGFTDRIEMRYADVMDPADPISWHSPLGKVPVLLRDDGRAVYDSPVILEYLDHVAGGARIFPREPQMRFAALTLEALCDGAIEASRLIYAEGYYRPLEHQSARYVQRQTEKVERTLAALEVAPPVLSDMPDVGQIALACFLGYRDFRFDPYWRDTYPRLRAWHDAFAAAVPAFAATAPDS